MSLKTLLVNILNELTSHLQGENETRSKLDNSIQQLINFTNSNPESISRGVKGKVVGYLQKVQEGIENCLAIHIHRTPISLKAYCKIFIYIFPIIYTPSIINKIGVENPQWLTFFVIILSEFILILSLLTIIRCLQLLHCHDRLTLFLHNDQKFLPS